MRTLAVSLIMLLGVVCLAPSLAAQEEQDSAERDRNKINTQNSGGPPMVPASSGVERDRNKIDIQNSGGPPSASGTTTGTMAHSPGLASETEQGDGMDVDVDTGGDAAGAVDVDVDRSTDADTDASGIDESGGLADDATGVYDDQDTLSATASSIPLVGLTGLISILGAIALGFWRRRKP